MEREASYNKWQLLKLQAALEAVIKHDGISINDDTSHCYSVLVMALTPSTRTTDI